MNSFVSADRAGDKIATQEQTKVALETRKGRDSLQPNTGGKVRSYYYTGCPTKHVKLNFFAFLTP